MFEKSTQPLLPSRHFYPRLLRYTGIAGLIISVSLLIGMVGYQLCTHRGWVDAFYNASMILTGMGPGLDMNELTPGQQESTKIFSGIYALYSGVVFLAASGLILSPVLHRFLHIFHLDLKG
jgi:hypothetical protein